ncbi:MAG: hypothetical protein ABS58_13320 [Mesorhizobium sp. SCN 65-20]|nr:MAG: hypothetical protein ABS58_13320 [Mesorhizobium sp. SCN 65-20]
MKHLFGFVAIAQTSLKKRQDPLTCFDERLLNRRIMGFGAIVFPPFICTVSLLVAGIGHTLIGSSSAWGTLRPHTDHEQAWASGL